MKLVQRLDKWLWFARVAKHRSLAATLIEQGQVRLNRTKITKPAHPVREGDVLTITVQDSVRVLKVRAEGSRRAPFRQACELYEDLTLTPSHGEKDRA